jgi:hypothetical protein
VSTWRIRAIGVVLLLALCMLIPAWGPYEITLWFLLLFVVLFAPIPKRWRKSTTKSTTHSTS